MLNYNPTSMMDDEFDESIHHRIRIGNNSGYLDEEYELSKDFPPLDEHHFRIEDDTQILSLEKLRRESAPIAMQSTFNSSSNEFKMKLNRLLEGLDSQAIQFDNHMQVEKHGFYTLADNYEDESVINSMLEQAKVEELRVQMQEISIKDMKPVFIKKAQKASKPENHQKDVEKLSRKMNRLAISEQFF